jgi:uncharacterized membrane protein YeiH
MATVPDATVEIPQWLEMTAIVAGSLAGSARAVRDQLAISGVVALAVAGGLGGGIIRDLLLQAGTPVAFTDSWLLVVAIVSALPALLIRREVHALKWPMETVGALSLGIYSILGADKAMLLGLPPAGAILIGVLAGTGGSILADLAVGVPPALFRPGKLQGIASAFGVAVFVTGAYLTDQRVAFFIVGVGVSMMTRMLSLVTGLSDAPADAMVQSSGRALRRIPHPPPPRWWQRRGVDRRGDP